MNEPLSKNKRIAYNTVVLYVKLILTTIIGLYSSRYVLAALGVSDYGLYAIIGGIVTIMNFLGSVMTTTSYRFITVELGKQEKGDLNRVYNSVRVIHILLAALLLIVGETIGVYYVENYLNVPSEKISDAIFVLHWSIFTSIITILSIPSNGLMIAKEKFLFTASLEITKTILKLILVIFLTYYLGNRLRLYAILTFIYMALPPVCTIIYCQIKEKEITKWNIQFDKSEYKNIFSFASWIMLGAGSTIAQNQGLAVIINIFFSTAVNAAYGLASQINTYVMTFVKSIGQAAIPQIMKNFSTGNISESQSLVYHIAKYSFFIVLFPAVPCIFYIDIILELWLENVPDYSSQFATLLILSNTFWCLSTGFDSTIQAGGNIKRYQIGFCIINLTCLPISVILFSLGLPPYAITSYIIISNFLLLLLQISILRNLKAFSWKEYYAITIKPALKVLLSLIPILIISSHYKIESKLTLLVSGTLFFVIYIGVVEIFIGLSANERKTIKKYINNKWKIH